MCDHPGHNLTDAERLMLGTAVVAVQEALWGHHAPTVFGNNAYALGVAKSLGAAMYTAQEGSPTVHHASDGCWHVHYGTRAVTWNDHLASCTNDKEN